MNKCIKCGATITSGLDKCPYCGYNQNSKEIEKRIERRIRDIDIAFGLNPNYKVFNTEELTEYLDNINSKLDELSEQLSESQEEEIKKHIYSISDELDDRSFVDDDSITRANKIAGSTNKSGKYDQVIYLLDKGPEFFPCAAVILRQQSEINMEKMGLKKIYRNGNWSFNASLTKFFKKIADNNKDATKIANVRKMTNCLIHPNRINNNFLKSKYGDNFEIKNALIEGCKLYKYYDLIN